MNNRNHIRLATATLLLAITITTSAFAQLIGDGNPDYDLIAGTAPQLQTQKVTFLGVTTKSADATLQSQLKLPEGVGLVVTFVDAKGPAAADMRVGDVLQKLDDQLLIDTHQLVTLVRLHHPGDTVALTLIREAKPMTATIKLGEKEIHVHAPKPDDDPVKSENLPGVIVPDDPTLQIPLAYRLPNGSLVWNFDDDVYSATVNTDKDGTRQMVVNNKDGTLVAKGPIDTEAQWNAFPEPVRDHLTFLHKMLAKKPRN